MLRKGWMRAGLLLCLVAGGCGGKQDAADKAKKAKADGKLDVLCSFFPIYLFTKAVVGDRPNVPVELMLPAEMGCPHDYDLQPADVRKIQTADLFIINGAGLEEFSKATVTGINPTVTVVDTAKGIVGIPLDEEHDHHDHDHAHEKDEHHDHDHAHEDHDHDHGHHHEGGINPHFFSSPKRAASQVRNIADALSEIDPEGAEQYRKNADAFIASLDRLSAELNEKIAALPNRKIVTMHEIFDYFARDYGLEIVPDHRLRPATILPPPGMCKVIEAIKVKKAGAVFKEPQYSGSTAETIGKDAGVPVGLLDPVASGPADAKPRILRTKMRQPRHLGRTARQGNK
ncbi:MAG: metal ABC transporter substrate-binding protein [Planctomycetota bacterium]